MLEREFPLFDQPREHSLADQDIHRRMRHLLEFHRDEIAQPDRDLATYVVLRIMESLVHAAALEPPAGFSSAQLEQAVVDAIMGYLSVPAPPPASGPRRARRAETGCRRQRIQEAGRQFRRARHIQPRIGILAMRLDGLDADLELLRDLLRAIAPENQADDLGFARRQPFRQPRMPARRRPSRDAHSRSASHEARCRLSSDWTSGNTLFSRAASWRVNRAPPWRYRPTCKVREPARRTLRSSSLSVAGKSRVR